MREAEKFLASGMKFRGRLCAVAIAVSFFIIILSLGISGGFRNEIYGSLRKTASDIVLSPVDGEKFAVDSTIISRLLAIEGVESAEPVVYKAGIVRDSTSRGIMFKGMGEGDGELTARIPAGLASGFGLSEGGSFTSYFLGSRLKARNFKVGTVYENPLESEDKTVIFTSIDDLRRVCGYGENEADAIELGLSDRIRTREEYRRMALEAGAVCYQQAGENGTVLSPETLYEKFPQLFDWLDLIDVNVLAILILMTIVAGFNMISGLLIVLFRSISTIGTLKSLGMTDRGIAGVFLRLSARMVIKGMAVGNAAALAICWIQSATHLLKLDPANYFLSFVPVSIDFGQLLLCDLAAFAGIMLLLLIPTLFISRVDPALTVKAN